MAKDALSLRDLNRATLARQLLLKRGKTTPVRAIEQLAGLQAQLPRPPFIGLWSRIQDFARDDLARSIERREIVRATLMRCTLHLFSARDYRRLRPSLQPALEKAMKSALQRRLQGLDLQSVTEAAKQFFQQRPSTFDQLRDHLSGLQPKADARAMGYAVRCRLPLVQVPVEGSEWAYPGTADFALAEPWLDSPIDGDPGPAELVLRYLAAFGPATGADAQTWSGLQGLKETFEALRPKLRTSWGPDGRELFDLAKAPRPGGELPVPVRFLPEYDNLLLGHDDRRRLIADEYRPALFRPNLLIPPTFLVDGFVAGTWKVTGQRKLARLEALPFRALSKSARDELAAEAEALLGFIEPDAVKLEVHFAKPG
jgi:hypothetical protein